MADGRLELTETGRFLTVAQIARPQGRRGEVAAEMLTDFPERFAKLQQVFLQAANGETETRELESAWPHKGRIILKFSGVDSITDAEKLRGMRVLVPEEQKVSLPQGSYYLWELAGCRVVRASDGNESEIGTVTDVERTGGVDLLHVAVKRGKGEVLIPLAETICTRIDTKAKVIWVDPPEDLLELNL